MTTNDNTLTYWLGNLTSAGAVVSALIGFLPALAAAIALVWYIIQIYESDTVKTWRVKRKIQRIARLKARLLMLESKPAPLPPEIEKKL
jgi:hypothetical protein